MLIDDHIDILNHFVDNLAKHSKGDREIKQFMIIYIGSFCYISIVNEIL